jgi:hypothetical protein
VVVRDRDIQTKEAMKTRTDLLNFLAEKYNLQSYLEIGVQHPEQNFDKIKCDYKASVDPDPEAKAMFCMTSDDYFKVIQKGTFVYALNKEVYPQFDLIFIDGLHTAEQVKKDFENALKILSPNGFIVLHDCNPEKEEHTIVPRPTERGHWNGDVYKFAVSVQFPKKTVNIDNGCMVLHDGFDFIIRPDNRIEDITWAAFDDARGTYLNLISWDEFVRSHS